MSRIVFGLFVCLFHIGPSVSVAGRQSVVGSASDLSSKVHYPVWPHTVLSFPLPLIQEAVVSYWQKYVHLVLINLLGGLSLPRKSVVRLPS